MYGSDQRVRRRSHHRTGFSLFELMLVLALLTVFVGLATPGILRWKQRLHCDQAIACVQIICSESRMKAIQSGIPIHVHVLRQGHTLQSSTPMPVTYGPREVHLPAGCSVRLIQAERRNDQANVTRSSGLFFPDGTAGDATFQLFDKDQQLFATLRIDRLTGTARRQ